MSEPMRQSVNSRLAGSCACCMLNRRRFLAGCAACVAGAGGVGLLSPRRAAAAEDATKPRVRLVYSYAPSTGPIWPNIGYDFDRRKKELTAALEAACPGIEFKPISVQNADEAKKMLDEDKGIDGYLVYILGLWTGAPRVIAASGRPTVCADDLYGGSGEFLIANAAARRAKLNVAGVSSSRVEDVAAVARCFEVLKKPGATVDAFMAAAEAARRKGLKKPGDLKCAEDKAKITDPADCLKKLKASTMLVVGANNPTMAKGIQDVFGTKVIPIDFKELHGAYEQADQDEAAKWADRWMKRAEKVVEPGRDEIVRSGAMYLAELALLKKYSAQAITINCLGGFYDNHIKAYPCLGFAQLNDDGLIGACEADQLSTITMLAMNALTGRPGYISDPVIDTSKNQIIYAHCVASTKVFGPDGKSNPYLIRSHSEDRKGAVVQSLMPLGFMTTTVEFHPVKKAVIFHQGKAVANVDEDKACRSKLAVEVKGDMDKLLAEWDQWGWHRVTVYGDLKEPVNELAKALDLKVINEA
ncbi:MAG TPA: hypothetical protein PKY77_16440 [Phycisphaerae bacterium]|nr:hypothetical protein [Phycisphaerae bacterium]HRY66971.1 hypothetical protein [Phycisphaerae bacterium]HSA29563.1 hypothetical protein [Phycisphaerae bacterium]